MQAPSSYYQNVDNAKQNLDFKQEPLTTFKQEPLNTFKQEPLSFFGAPLTPSTDHSSAPSTLDDLDQGLGDILSNSPTADDIDIRWDLEDIKPSFSHEEQEQQQPQGTCQQDQLWSSMAQPQFSQQQIASPMLSPPESSGSPSTTLESSPFQELDDILNPTLGQFDSDIANFI